jgi:hypothetical protein
MPPKKTFKKSPPISKFKNAGAEAGSPFRSGKKDDRHKLFYKGVQNGVMVLWLKQGNENAEPFCQPIHKVFREDAGKMVELNICAILNRRGDDGEKMMQSATSEYPWRQFMIITGEKNNTPAKRKEYAEALVTFFNSLATKAHYTFVRKIKIGEDLTANPLETVDTVLLDRDVVGLMLSAYEDTPLEEVVLYDKIMKTFWKDIAHGREVVEAVVATTEGKQQEGVADGDEAGDEEGGGGEEGEGEEEGDDGEDNGEGGDLVDSDDE